MTVHDMPGLSRREFLNAAAGLGAAASAGGLAACTSTGSGSGRPAAAGRGFADAVLAAFKTHRLVALGAADSLQDHYDALGLLLADPRLPGVVDDIIVEWGNPLYQHTLDAFIAGQPVADADLRPVWRNTAQSPLETWDAPVYEQFYRLVRAVNWPLPASQQIRVLAGDSPIDWAKITTASQLRAIPPRNSYVASLVDNQVLAKGRRALLCYGMLGLFHGKGMTSAIEQRTGQRIYVIADLVPLAGDPGGLAGKLSRYPRNTIIPTAGTWLGSFDAGMLVAEAQASQPGTPANTPTPAAGQPPNGTAGGGPHPQRGNPFCGVRLGSLIDAGLYCGQPAGLTATWPDPGIKFDPAYWAELKHRNALKGDAIDLEKLRHEHPAPYPLTTLAPSQQCGKNPQASS